MKTYTLFVYILSFFPMLNGCDFGDDSNREPGDAGNTLDTDDDTDIVDTEDDTDIVDTEDDTDTQDIQDTVVATLVVQDAFGSLIPEIDVTYEGETKVTDSSGAANFDVPAEGTYHFATTHEDYEDEIDRRMTASLAYAKEDMDDLLRGGGYDVPFVGAAITSTIKRCCALKAGAWLFEWRRDDDEDDRYNNMEKKADRLIEQIRRDVRRFDTSLQTVKGTRAPSAE